MAYEAAQTIPAAGVIDVRTIADLPNGPSMYIFGAGNSGRLARELVHKAQKGAVLGYIDTYKTGWLDGLEIIDPATFLTRFRPGQVDVLVAADAHEAMVATLLAAGVRPVHDAFELVARERQRMTVPATSWAPFPNDGCAAAVLHALECGIEGAMRFLLGTLKDRRHERLSDHVHAGRVLRSLVAWGDRTTLPADIRQDLDDCADALACLETQSAEYYSLVFLQYDLKDHRPFEAFRREGLISPVEIDLLGRLVDEVARPGLRICEVGSFIGRGSTRWLAGKVRSLGGRLVCVDPLPDSLFEPSMWDAFQASVRSLGIQDVIENCRMPSLHAVREYPDGCFDLVFIDGDHGYDMVKADLQAWLPKVRPGGYLCGHDVLGHERQFPEGILAPFRRESSRSQEGIPLEHDGHPCMLQPGVVAAVCDVLGEHFQCAGHPNGIWWHRVAPAAGAGA